MGQMSLSGFLREQSSPIASLIMIFISAISAHYVTHAVLVLLGEPAIVLSDVIGPFVNLLLLLPFDILALLTGRVKLVGVLSVCFALAYYLIAILPNAMSWLPATRHFLFYLLLPAINFIALQRLVSLRSLPVK